MFFLICLEELHSLEAPTSFVFQLKLEGGSNPLFSQATTSGKLQLPNYDSYNHKQVHQPIPQPVINLYHKQVHQPTLYHKQVHQPCTNLYQTICNKPIP
jgi:hypothetical protein